MSREALKLSVPYISCAASIVGRYYTDVGVNFGTQLSLSDHISWIRRGSEPKEEILSVHYTQRNELLPAHPSCDGL